MQPLDDRRAGRGRADARVLHRLAELGVLDVLAGGLHRAEEGGLREAPRRLGLLAERLDRAGLDVLALLEPRAGAGRRPSRPRPPASAPPRRRPPSSRLRPARGRTCGRRARRPWSRPACARRRRRGGRRPGSAWRRGRRCGSRPAPSSIRSWSERVGMIAWWSSTRLSLTTRPSGSFSRRVTYSAALRVAVVAPHVGRGRLDLADHVGGEEARARARVRDRLVLLVEPLRRGERAPRGEAEEGVRIPLERREVVEELRRLALVLLLQLRDRARLPGRLGDDRRRPRPP